MKKFFTAIIIIISANIILSCSNGGSESSYNYHTVDEVETFLDEVKLRYPVITSIENAGYSTEGRTIRAIVISDNPGMHEGEPAIRLTGGIHGNEMVTVELMIQFIEYLTYNYGKDAEVTDIVNSRYIVIIPVMNPDGLEAKTRYNSNGVDLNRNFSVAWAPGTSRGSYAFSEAESRSLRDFSLSQVFHLSATYHSGAVVLNMPFDYAKENVEAPVENDLVKEYAKSYTTAGTFLDNPDLMQSVYMDEGTINGGDWYIITGSLQDWSYRETGCLDFTIEVADEFSPATLSGVRQVFMYNRDSIMAYIKKAGYGVHGRIADASGNPVAGVDVYAAYNDGSGITGDIITETDSQGYYHRILLPGSYTLTFKKSGYTDIIASGITVPDNSAGILQNVVMN